MLILHVDSVLPCRLLERRSSVAGLHPSVLCVIVSAALQEVSCRVRGFLGAGVDGDAVHSSSKAGTKNEQGSRVAHGPQGQYAAPSARGSGANVLIVVLESTSGIYVTPTNDFGVSPWAEELSRR